MGNKTNRKANVEDVPLGTLHDEIVNIVASNTFEESMRKVKEILDQWKLAKLNVCILGKSGVGKSSFINNVDKRFGANVGRVEMTTKATAYHHPDNDNLVFWDLPGFGCKIYDTVDKYVTAMKMERFDLILFLYKDRFEKTDCDLSKAIKKVGIPFFIVRTRFDIDTQDIEEENVEAIEKEKDEITSELEKNGLPRTEYPCFFISNRSRKYDYVKLMQKLLDAVVDVKREALLYTIKNTNTVILDLKRKQLEKRIWVAATISAGIAAIPVPGLDIPCNISILVHEAIFMAEVLGITEVADATSKWEVLKQCGSYLSPAGVTGLVATVAVKAVTGVGLLIAQNLLAFLPVVGSLISSPIAFAVAYYSLKEMLEKFIKGAEDKMRMELDGAF